MIYLIPSFLSENAVETIPPYVIDAVKKCETIFAENLRTARRYLKKMDPSIVIDNFQWIEIKKEERESVVDFLRFADGETNAAIISEAGCPGVADPGQTLVSVAQSMNIDVRPLVGPNSILLALMASGMNGQQFAFHGYLPIDSDKRSKKIKQLEDESLKKNCTQIFIETPYRNDAMMKELLRVCDPRTYICIAADITSENEFIKTKKAADWKDIDVKLHKRPVIFLLLKQ